MFRGPSHSHKRTATLNDAKTRLMQALVDAERTASRAFVAQDVLDPMSVLAKNVDVRPEYPQSERCIADSHKLCSA